ncbi:MFS transporter, partial [Escherichia coli]|uniref:MFS transporter n=1 Tax=Escherichia coli TaxID=562 RepID=UPI0013028B02
LLIGAGIFGSFAMTELWQLTLLWGVVVGFGTGLTAMVLGATVATRWFATRRGLVVGLLTASTATGQLVFLPLMASLTESLGWRDALTLILAMLFIAAVVVLVFMQDHPADVGLAPYGAKEGAVVAPAPPATLSAMLASPISVLMEAAQT